MKTKKTVSMVMLIVLAMGLACMIYGVTGRRIYSRSAAMMGWDQKSAMTYIEHPERLKALGKPIRQIGAENIKNYLKKFGEDAAAVDAAVDEAAAYEEAYTQTADREALKEWVLRQEGAPTQEEYQELIKGAEYKEQKRNEMTMSLLGIESKEQLSALASNETLLSMYRAHLNELLTNRHMTSAVVVQFLGLILLVAALSFFSIQAMDIRPRRKTRSLRAQEHKLLSFLLDNALFLIMGLILVIVSILKNDFLSADNILNILQNASTKGILALGCAGLIVLAGTDLSIGRVLGISAAVTASLVQSVTYASRMYPTMISPLGTLGLLIPLFASIAIAVTFSLINGFGVAKLHLHAFIVTLGTQLIAYGANCLYIESQPSGAAQALSTLDPTFLRVAAGAITIGSVRIPVVVLYFIVIAVIMWVIWNRTRLGKNMFAVGGNPEAAAVSGVNVAKTIMLVYLMAGILYGIAAFLEAGRITSVGANTGINYETDAISAVVVGGVSFSGGVGTIQGVVIGAVILQAIVYALQFLGVNPYIQYIIRGLIIVLAVSIDVRKYIENK